MGGLMIAILLGDKLNAAKKHSKIVIMDRKGQELNVEIYFVDTFAFEKISIESSQVITKFSKFIDDHSNCTAKIWEIQTPNCLRRQVKSPNYYLQID